MMERFFALAVSYARWHYTAAFADALRLFLNFFWFIFNFFSIGILARTLFSPWKRIHERARSVGFAGKLILSTMARAVGFAVRGATLAVGVCALAALTALFAASLALWSGFPLIWTAVFFKSLTLLFSL